MKKQIFWALALICLCLVLLSPGAAAAETVASGSCGENLTWTLDDSGMLTISGTGDMTDFDYFNTPWAAHRDCITTVHIQEGVTSIGNSAFMECAQLTAVTIADSVTHLCISAFNGCTGLTEVTIGSGLAIIDNHAFRDCTSLTGITIPDSVEHLGQYAFYGCTALTDVTIGSSVSTIEKEAFKNCTSLTRIVIPDSVKYLGTAVFYGCTGMTEVTLGSGITSIDYDAFRGCYCLTSITIPDSVTYLAPNAFADCYALTSVTLGNQIKWIRNGSFQGCTSLTSIIIPDSVNVIERNAFKLCTALTDVYFGRNVYNIAENAFYGCDKLTSFQVHEDNFYLSSRNGVVYDKTGTTLVLYPLGKHGHFNVPDDVTTIGPNAFSYCSHLTSITFGPNLSYIDGAAFQKCSGLTRITFTGDPPIIGPTTFFGVEATAYYIWGNEAWTDEFTLDYGGSLTWDTREPDCDHDWNEAENIEPTCTEPGYTKKVCKICTYPVTEQTADALGHDNTTVTIDPACETGGSTTNTCTVCGYVSVQKLYPTGHSYENGRCTVCGAEKPDWIASGTCGYGLMWSLEPNGTLTVWGEGDMDAYEVTYHQDTAPWGQYRDKIRKVVLQDGVTGVGSSAFENCAVLTVVTLADSVTVIGEKAFKNCYSLADVYLGTGLVIISDEAFYSCKNIAEITFPDPLTEIGDRAFIVCSSLRSITLPDVIQKVGERAFYQCTGLIYISLPAGISTHYDSFSGCKGLWHVINRNQDGPLHNFGAEVIHGGDAHITATKTEPTCSEAGSIIYSCSQCQDTRSVTLSPSGHQWKSATCTAPRTCTICSATTGSSLGGEHIWNEGIVVQEPKDDQVGVMQYTCTICYESKLEMIEAAGTTPENPPEPKNGSLTFILAIAGAAVVIIGIAVLITIKQRKA